MTAHSNPTGRRRFIKIVAGGVAAAPFASALVSTTAHAVDKVAETDPTAAALGYRADATKAAGRKDPKAECDTCNLYTGKAGAAEGPCSIFSGKLVNAKGWCSAWVKKA